MSKTVEDLRKLRDEMVERRVVEAYRVGSATHTDAVERLARLQSAIQAIDAVIAEGRDQPEVEPGSIYFA